jgi:tRNA1(Val) A37 N6-methylase TrmN6
MASSQDHRYSQPLHEPALLRAERRARGIYFTPPEMASLLAERCWAAWQPQDTQSPRVLDLACGAGALLHAVASRFRMHDATCGLVGIDRDAGAIAEAGRQLASFSPELHVADGLFANFASQRQFEIILGNPPFINIRQAAKEAAHVDRDRIAGRFRSARGSYDLFILFCERAWELLAPGGVLGFIVPDKFGSAEYAQAFRRQLLDEGTIIEICDLGEERVFRQAAVYPWMIIARKATAAPTHVVPFRWRDDKGQVLGTFRLQHELSADALAFGAALQWNVPTAPLGSRATLACGATGYRARRLAQLLREADDLPSGFKARPFIVSGSIDPFMIKSSPVRFQRRCYERPVIEEHGGMSLHQRALFARQKLVIAGLAQRIEAAWDSVGRALGVQVFAAYDLIDDPFYLLGLLNSKLLCHIFRQQFAARRMAGGYLTFNKGPLSKLPIRLPTDTDASDRRHVQRLVSAAKELHRLGSSGDLRQFHVNSPALTAQINDAALALYRLSERELAEASASRGAAA